MSLPIIRRKIRSGFIRLGLARAAAERAIRSQAETAVSDLLSLRTRYAPPTHPRPTWDRMPVPPDPAFPVEIQWNIDGYNQTIKEVSALPWPPRQNAPERRVVMLAVSNLRIDPRIERESRALAGRGYEVVVVAPDISTPPLIGGTPIDWGPNVTFDILPANEANFVGWSPYFYSKAMIEAAVGHRPFAIHGNDLWTCLIALEVARRSGGMAVADFHEWTSENVSWDVRTKSWRRHDDALACAFREMEVLTMRRAAATITVNETIARALEDMAGLERGGVDIIRNIPKLDAVPTREYRPIKEELGLPSDAFVVIYQGGTGPSRLLEPIIEALVYAPSAYLVIRGPSLDMFGDHYRRTASRAGVQDRVILQGPVPSRDVVAAAKGADLGIWSLPDISKNFRFALPNKVFEYLAAGVPLAVANYPEPAAIVERNQCGVTFDPYSPRSIADAILRMQSDPDFHQRCAENTAKALKSLDADAEWERYADLFDRLWAKMTKGESEKARPLRVLHAPCNVGNQPWTLSRAERALGLRSELVVNYSTKFAYPADRVLGTIGGRVLNYQSARRAAAAASPYDYDVFHYYFGRSLSVWDDIPDLDNEPFADLRTARALGKPVFMTLQGCDARLATESNRRNAFTPCAMGKCIAYETCVSQLDTQRRALINDILPLCDRVFFLNPELGHFVPNGTFLPYANVDIRAITPRGKRAATGKPRIVHAPSDPAIKGTHAIVAALESLADRYDFELVLVQNKTHEEAMAIYASADLAIDQLYAGWYGGFAVELMALGVPVVSYLRQEDFVHVPDALRTDLPILNMRPDSLVDDLESALQKQGQWPALGADSRAYVEKWHDPHKIAKWLAWIYKNPAATGHFDPIAEFH